MNRPSDTKDSLRELIDFVARGAAPPKPATVDPEEAIHEARVRAKRMTAALHLYKPSIDREKFRQELKQIRRASEILAGRRDDDSIRRMLLCCAAGFEARARRPLEKWLEKHLGGPGDASAESDLRRARKRMDIALREWPQPEGVTAQDLFAQGSQRSFEKARDAFRKARKSHDAEDFHRWRIWTKRLLHQLELAGELNFARDQKALAKIDKLQKALGDLHDLHVAETWLKTAEGGPAKARKLLRRRMRGTCARLGEKTLKQGEKLFRRKWRKRLRIQKTSSG